MPTVSLFPTWNNAPASLDVTIPASLERTDALAHQRRDRPRDIPSVRCLGVRGLLADARGAVGRAEGSEPIPGGHLALDLGSRPTLDLGHNLRDLVGRGQQVRHRVQRVVHRALDR